MDSVMVAIESLHETVKIGLCCIVGGLGIISGFLWLMGRNMKRNN